MMATTVLVVGVKSTSFYVLLRMTIAYVGNRFIRWLRANWVNEENQLRAAHSFILLTLYVGLMVLLRMIKYLF